MDPIVVADAVVEMAAAGCSWEFIDMVGGRGWLAEEESWTLRGTGMGLGEEGEDMEADWTADEVKILVPE